MVLERILVFLHFISFPMFIPHVASLCYYREYCGFLLILSCAYLVLGLLDHGPASSSICEIHVEEVNALEGVGSLKSGESNHHSQVSNCAFNLCPTIHIKEETPNLENGNLISQQFFEAEYEREFPHSCPEPIVCKEPIDVDSHGIPPVQALNSSARRKYFSPHWPAEVTREALEVCFCFTKFFTANYLLSFLT